MQHDAAIRQLLEIGKQQNGHVTLAQVKDLLPVETMSQDELGRAVLQLEEAGVQVRLEADLLRSRPENWDGKGFPAHLLQDDAEPETAPPEPPARRAESTASYQAPAGAGRSPGQGWDGRRVVLLTLVAAVPLALIVVVLYVLTG